MRKLILKNGLSPGDIVMLTAAVRDLHLCYPKQFITDIRTPCPELWENNPFITPISENDPDVEVIECSYPLINRCNDVPYHCLHGFIEFLNDHLGLSIRPTAFKGDLCISDLEKSWYSQVYELTGKDIPFWIIAAGGKYDVTVKWWETQRYQAVVDYFRGKIQFVQVGELGHHHPRLRGVIDLRGQTDLRELVRLVYHSQGVLCPVTALMHLAAAVEFKERPDANRPCVVVAGGREPAHWEAYPDHQFVHTVGALRCCSKGGCWKDRVLPLGDGDERDRPEHLCVDVVRQLPRCMDMITSAEVIRRIEMYFTGGLVDYLSPTQLKAAKRAVSTKATNPYDGDLVTLHNARLACERFIRTIPSCPDRYRGRGIVICGGGVRYFTNAWVCIKMLRRMGCSLPIEIWHLGLEELDDEMKSLVRPLNVECIDATAMRKNFPVRILGGWELKPYSIIHSRFQEVLFLDADNVPVVNPGFLFETPQFQQTGAIFWPDYGRLEKSQIIWDNCGLTRPEGPEFETGQIVVDKQRCWQALSLCMWFNEHSDFYYQHLHGDKETFHLAFHKMNKSFSFVSEPIHSLPGTMCQHDFEGNRIFQHRNMDKWNLFFRNKHVADFQFEDECRQYLRELQQQWDGRTSYFSFKHPRQSNGKQRKRAKAHSIEIIACMISCPQRDALRQQTLSNLAATDWGERPIHIQMDPQQLTSMQERQAHNTWLALTAALESKSDYLLFLEDDLDFNRYLWHNLQHWVPLQKHEVHLAGLYNPGLLPLAWDVKKNATLVDNQSIFGSQAFLISRSAIKFIIRHWNKVEGMQDIKMSRLAGRLGKTIFYHTPSLVQHVGLQSIWGGGFHEAADFDPVWRA